MHITALFTIAKLWNQFRCPPTDEWEKKMWCTCTMKNKIMLFAGKWVELEIIVLSEINQTYKDKYLYLSLFHACSLSYVGSRGEKT
jgi:hypothetical protein